MTAPVRSSSPAVAQTPERSLQQRYDALCTANAYRSARAALKRVVKDSGPVEARHRVAELIALEEPAQEFASMKVWDLLFAVPGAGRVKVNRLLIAANVSPSKTLGGLSERQRSTLSRLIKDAADRWAAQHAKTGQRA